MIVFVLLLVSAPILGQETATYTAENDAFTVTLPEGWTTENIPDGVEFKAPDGTVMYWIALPAADSDSGALAAIDLFAPDFAGTQIQNVEFPAPNGVWTQTLYLVGTDVAATLTLHYGESAYVLWLPPTDQAALTAVSPSINEMLVSLVYAGARDVTEAQVFTLEQDALDLLDAYVAEALVRFEMPGAAIAVVQNGGVIFTGGYGDADRESNTAVNDDTRFMIGSVTKSMTSWLAASLVDEGVFGWDTPITELYPAFTLSDPEQAAALTVRDFFSMSSGLPRYDLSMILEMRTPDELLAEMATIPLVAAPGEQFNYNNQMVALGGFITAAAAAGVELSAGDRAYADMLQTHLFDPLGMTQTTLDFDATITSGDAATPYYFDSFEEAYLPVPFDYERFVLPVAPAGAVWSTAGDMGLYLAAQMRDGAQPDGTPIVSAENMAVTKTGVIAIEGAGDYALGWMTGDWFGQPLLQHGGGTSGFTTTFAYLPDADVGVVVLSNRSSADGFGSAVRDYVFELAYALPPESEAIYLAGESSLKELGEMVLAQANPRVDAPADADAMALFLGEYEHGITIALDAAGRATASGDFGTIVLYPSGSSATIFVTSGVLGGLRVAFDDAAGVTMNLTNPLSGLPEGQPELTLRKLD